MSNDAVWVRGVTGIQLHHTTDLQDAGRFLGNAAMALRAAHVRTGDDRYSDLATELKAVLILARELEDEARAGLQKLRAEGHSFELELGGGVFVHEESGFPVRDAPEILHRTEGEVRDRDVVELPTCTTSTTSRSWR